MNKTAFGKFVSDTRRELGLTQQALADRLHVTDKAVSKWERGLSYPDVTLLEDLAAALEISTTELLSCRKDAVSENVDEVRSLMDIAKESGISLKKKFQLIVILMVVGIVLITGCLFFFTCRTVTTQEYVTVWGKQIKNDGSFVYVEKNERLLVLSCPNREVYDSIIADNRTTHSLEYRWNPRTYRGTLLRCVFAPDVDAGSKVSDMTGSAGSIGELFGVDAMICRYQSVHRDSSREGGYLFTLIYYYAGDGKDYYLRENQPETSVLTVKDCRDMAYVDFDGDGITELLVLTQYDEAPYRLYDMENGQIVSALIEEIPSAVDVSFSFPEIRN